MACEDTLVTLRRDLHQIPEVGLRLPRTQERVLAALAPLGLEIATGQELDSVVAVLRGRAPAEGERRVALLRGDMDALPVTERSGEDFASTNGAMHACGHDLHMAMLVGAAQRLARRVEELPGDVVFMFQPGEEGDDGARRMIEEGLLEAAGRRPDAAFALHVWASTFPTGSFATRPGTVMAASDPLDVVVHGRGGHGSAPHLAKDPVPVLAEIIGQIQVMLARRFDLFDPALVTVGHLGAGEARNVIPDTAWFEATMRTFSPEARERLFAHLAELLEGIGRAHGVEVEHTMTRLYPVTLNDAEQTAVAMTAVRELFGDDRLLELEHSMTASEDFSKVLEEVPGCFLLLGAAPAGLDPAQAPNNHSAEARYDESVLGDGADLLAELAVRTLTPTA
ncbi:M20 family metallopeptidase [Luteococcus peritonei]|uniref:M20 family metallopeptidase n=1 Tax=Luteococcus peritonei TaxID=88874 RepID=A0ABW4RTW1_9ACTN